jgi:hypothetical protein
MLLRHQTGSKLKIMLEKYTGSISLRAKLQQLRHFQNNCNLLWISIVNLQVSPVQKFNARSKYDGTFAQVQPPYATILGSFSET